jgi:serine O-acetyltransferase
MAKKDLYTRLVYLRKKAGVGKLAYFILKVLGVEIPLSVEIGKNFYLVHGAVGTVIHPHTKIGNNVKVYPGVVLGRADIDKSQAESSFEGFVIEDDVILGAGAKVMGKEGFLTVRKGSMIGANAVLTESTGEGETWAGVPARKIK